MISLRAIFWTTIFWIFVVVAGIAYIRIFDMTLLTAIFPQEALVGSNEEIATSCPMEEQFTVLQTKLDANNEILLQLVDMLDTKQGETTTQPTTTGTNDASLEDEIILDEEETTTQPTTTGTAQ